MTGLALLTLRFRLLDKHAAALGRQARAVSFVWNFCNATQQKAARNGRKWLSRFELHRLTAGSCHELCLPADTIGAICDQYSASRITKRRPWLRFRGKKSLGWVPFKRKMVRIVGPGRFKYHGTIYETMHWRELPADLIVRAGSFSQDARGRWYINAIVEMPALSPAPTGAIGIDLGLKDIAVLSTGERIGNPRHFAGMEDALGCAQRAHKARLARRFASQIAAARRDYLHKVSATITAAHSTIVVGNVSSSQLTQTSMAKSVLDAGWSTLRNQLLVQGHEAWRENGRSGRAPDYPGLLRLWRAARGEAERYRGPWNKRMELQRVRGGPRPRRERCA